MANTNNSAFQASGLDVIIKALTEALGSVMPAGSEGLISLALPQLLKMAGLSSDIMLNTPMLSNTSLYGVFKRQEQNLVYRAGADIPSKMAEAQRYQFFEDITRTVMGADASEEDIRAAAQGVDSNALYQAGYALLDPKGMRETASYMSLASSNMIRPALARGDRDSFAKTKTLIGGMFQDATGAFSYDKSEYGNMEAKETAALTAALTRDTDFLSGVDLNSTKSLESAASRLKDKVKEYAQALSPLKDIFGSDMNELLTSIEEISGQTIAQMGPARARDIATLVTDRTSTGRYGVGELVAMKELITAKFGSMENLSPMARLHATRASVMALDFASGSVLPSNMSKADFVNAASNFAISTISSPAAEFIDQAYSIWANDRTKAGEGSSLEEFKSLIDARTDKYGNPVSTAMALAEVKNTYELERGLFYEGYSTAKAAGFGGIRAAEASYSAAEAGLRNYMVHDRVTQAALRDYAGAEGWGAGSTDSIFSDAMSMLDSDSTLFNMSGSARRARLAELDPSASSARINQIDAILTGIANSKEGKEVVYKRFALTASRAQQEAAMKAAEQRRAVEDFTDFTTGKGRHISSSYKNLVLDLVRGGLKPDALKDYITGISNMSLTGSAETVEELKAGAIIAGINANKLFGTTEDDIKEKEKYIANFNRYMVSSDGLLNVGFRRHLGEWSRATDAGEKEFHENMLAVYRGVTPEALDRYINREDGTVTTEAERIALRRARSERLVSTFKAGGSEGITDVLKEIQTESVFAQIDKMDAEYKDSAAYHMLVHMGKNSADPWSKESFDKTIAEQREDIGIFYEEGSEEYKSRMKEVDAMVNAYNMAIKGVAEQPETLTTVLGSLDGAVKVMTQLIRELITKNKNSPVNTDEAHRGRMPYKSHPSEQYA